MTSFVPGQLLTAEELNTAFEQTFPAGSISSYSATLLIGTTQAAWFAALGLPAASPGNANGLATLDGSGLVPNSQLPPAIVGALYPKGGWNANTNNPALVSGVGTKGFFYVVTTPGATTVDGNNTWSVNDCIFFDGTIWRKINGSGNISIPATNISDSTPVGRALLTAISVAAQRVSLNIDQAQLVVDTNLSITSAMASVAWTSLTAPRVGSLPSTAAFAQGQSIRIYDESGNCSLTNTITINANGADTISGAASYVLNAPFAGVILSRASVAKWTALPFAPYVSTWITRPPNVRQTVISGPIDVNGAPTFLPASSASLSITSQNITPTAPFVVTAASGVLQTGQSDISGVATANITWSGLTANTTNYLILSIAANGTLAPIVTAIAPVYQQGGTPSVTNGTFTFNIGEMVCYLGNGTTATKVNAVFVAQVVAAVSTVISVKPYSYNGIYDGPYIATLPGAGLTVLNHNLGIMPTTCELFFKNTVTEFNYAVGDVIQGRPGMARSDTAAIYEAFVLTLAPTTISITSATGNYNVLNKTTGANVQLTNSQWSYRLLVMRGW